MSEKKIKKRYKDLKFMARQYVAGVLMVALLFNILPEILTPGLSKVYAVSISELILSAFVGSNLDDAANYDMLNTGLIEDAVRDCHRPDTRWSDIKMQDVLAALASKDVTQEKLIAAVKARL